MTDFKLNKEQKEAVEYTKGPLLIVAGAGTGKTAVITEKIVHVIEKEDIEPEHILALTFTDKAADEMEERVDARLSEGYVDLQISTFHTFCQRILESYGIHIGLPNNFRLLSETDAWILMRRHVHELGLDYYRPIGNPGSNIYGLLKHFSKCKDELISPEQYLSYAEGLKADNDAIQEDEKDRITELANVYHAYNQLLLDNNSLDFGDLISYTVKLLEERPAVLSEIQKRFTHILVDEFQDVNYAQYELIQKLAEYAQLTVVGDDDQSIYAFRGASVSNIMRFKEDYPKAKSIVLNKNYRSAQQVLDVAYHAIQNNNPDRLEEKLKINKKLESKIENQDAQVVHTQYPTIDGEAQGVVDTILRMKKDDSDLSWDDIAILVRANAHAEPFLGALERAGVPYEFISSVGLYRQPIVMDCFAFFKLLESHYDNLSIYRMLRLPVFHITERDIQLFTHMAKKKSVTYYEALKRAKEFSISDEGALICEKIVSVLHSGLKKAPYEKPTVVLYHFLDASGYLSYLTKEEESGNSEVIRQIYQLKQFFDLIASYESVTAGSRVRDFVEHFEQVLQSGDQGKMYQPEDTPDSVNILTIHGSKGLEFEHVFLVNLVDQRFPTRRRGELIPLPDDLIKEQLPEGDFHLQEERRLFYVGLTRAKRGLYLTSADFYGGVKKKKVSRFVHELSDILETIEGGKGVKKNKVGVFADASTQLPESVKGAFQYELPKVFSFSQLRAFDYCPYQYKLAHLLKIPMKGSPYFSYGNSIHNTLQEFYENVIALNSVSQGSLFGLPKKSTSSKKMEVPSLEDLLSFYEDAWITDWYNSKRQREEYYKKGKDVLKTFYKEHENNWTIPAGIESWFKVKVGDYLVHGRIDRFDVQEDGCLNIIDYKTGKGKEKLSSSDKRQLLLYQLAAESLPEYRNIGAVGKLTFYYLDDNMKTEFFGKEKEIEKLKDWIQKTIDTIYSKDFYHLTKNDMCGRCDFCKMGLV